MENRQAFTKALCVAFAFLSLLFLMTYQLTYSPLWGDEWIEYRISQLSIWNGEMYGEMIQTFQPPLFNLMMHYWLKISTSHFWFRFFNAAGGMIGGVFLFLTLKRLCGHYMIACLGVLNLALCYQWIYAVQEASEYAPMMVFLFAAIYFFVRLNDDWTFAGLLGLILSGVGAIYSQYGAVFVVFPMYVICFLHALKYRERRNLILISYTIALVVFAEPLYAFFLRHQLSENVKPMFIAFPGFSMFLRFPLTFGKLMGWLFSLKENGITGRVGSLVGVCVLLCFVFRILNRKTKRPLRDILIVFLSAYTLHFFLTEFKIYGLVHENQSYGFFCRYSLFYIPLLTVTVPALLTACCRDFSGFSAKHMIMTAAAGLLLFCVLSTSAVNIIHNWHKSFGDIYADLWIRNEGWNDVTYIGGEACVEETDYYLREVNHLAEEQMENIEVIHVPETLPPRFWIWKTNWDGEEEMRKIIRMARKQNYSITLFHEYISELDSGNRWALYYCAGPIMTEPDS